MLVWMGGKDVGENCPFDIDLSDRLAGDSIVSAAWSITVTDGELTIESPYPDVPAESHTATRAQVWLKGGTDGFTYQLQIAANTVGSGKPLIENVQLTCKVR